eukprot:scaffold37_cov116-Isochrysis_galbana.AAC.6
MVRVKDSMLWAALGDVKSSEEAAAAASAQLAEVNGARLARPITGDGFTPSDGTSADAKATLQPPLPPRRRRAEPPAARAPVLPSRSLD